MAIRSSLVTARSKAAVKKYEVPTNSKVSSNAFALNDKANSYYTAISKNYDNLKTHFTNLGNLYTECASKAVNGEELKKALNSIGKNCKNQGTYCGDRKKELKEGYKFAKLEAKYQIVLQKLAQYEKGKK